MKKLHTMQQGNNGFILPMVIVLLLLIGIIAAARLTQYRLNVQQRIEQTQQIKSNLALDSGLAWLVNTLNENPAFHGPETWSITPISMTNMNWNASVTNWITVTGDGHRFVIDYTSVRRKSGDWITNQASRIVTFENIKNPSIYATAPLARKREE